MVKMNGLEITKELKCDIESKQIELQNAIRSHQVLFLKVKEESENEELQKRLIKAEEKILLIGLEQKKLLQRLRDEFLVHQKTVKNSTVKNALEERRFNLSNALNRARKQNISVFRSASFNSYSEESEDKSSMHSSPEHHLNPVEPQDVSQTKFLGYFGLATHDVFKEMQNKRAERKKRSTANPHFLYGNKGWDFYTQPKRKRSAFLAQPISPPNTRQASRKRQERLSPIPTAASSKSAENSCAANNKSVDIKTLYSPFAPIPNLPSGLTIERVSAGSSSPDQRCCLVCKQPGVLSMCETCSNGFHVSCHNRPLAQTPKHCPKCIVKEKRTVGSLNVPSGMSVSCMNSVEVLG